MMVVSFIGLFGGCGQQALDLSQSKSFDDHTLAGNTYCVWGAATATQPNRKPLRCLVFESDEKGKLIIYGEEIKETSFEFHTSGDQLVTESADELFPTQTVRRHYFMSPDRNQIKDRHSPYFLYSKKNTPNNDSDEENSPENPETSPLIGQIFCQQSGDVAIHRTKKCLSFIDGQTGVEQINGTINTFNYKQTAREITIKIDSSKRKLKLNKKGTKLTMKKDGQTTVWKKK